MKKNKIPELDERQQLITLKAIRNAFFVLIAFILISMIYKIITVGSVGWELIALIIASVVIIVTRKMSGEVDEPRNVWNKPMPLGSSKKDRRARKISYLVDSLIFATICTALDVVIFLFDSDSVDAELIETFFPGVNITIVAVVFSIVSFIIMFAISYVFEYVVGEKFKVKKYNEAYSKMDDEENNVD